MRFGRNEPDVQFEKNRVPFQRVDREGYLRIGRGETYQSFGRDVSKLREITSKGNIANTNVNDDSQIGENLHTSNDNMTKKMEYGIMNENSNKNARWYVSSNIY